MVNIIESIEEEYNYTKERKEPFYLVSIPIKDKQNIYEALDEYCSEEFFEDDNKLFIDQYDKKISVSKKILFSKLPPTIIFNLKRFEYDMKTFQRYKLNDFFEFAEEIDLKSWLCEQNENGDENTNYRLKGVVIHSGSASAGHYYSYIRVDGKWKEFNDTNVRDFDASQESKHKEWFGSGKTSPDGAFGVAGLANNSTSAYMLFYERVEGEKMAEEGGVVDIRETEVGREMMGEIELENKMFLRSKIYSDSVSLRFIDGILDKLDDPKHLDTIESMLLNEEKTGIKDEVLLDMMVARNVSTTPTP